MRFILRTKDMRISFDISLISVPLILLGMMAATATTNAQVDDALQLFGSMQTIFFHQESRIDTDIPALGFSSSGTETRNTFALQQMDIFLRKEIDADFTAFVDLEFQLNYSSDQRWGSVSIQEAWLNYHLSDAINLKMGLLFPAFNHLNEIKNRLALQPYLFRPLVYERLLSRKFFAEDFIPEHAFFQVHGALPTGNWFVDYAAYAGNAEASYISRSAPDGSIITDLNPNFEFLSGVDPSNIKLKLFGGRLGVRTRDEQFKVGLSLTHDYNNLRDSTRYPGHVLSGPARRLLGSDAPRIRVGQDLTGRLGDFWLEFEAIKVLYNLDEADRLSIEIEQSFFSGVLGYDIIPEVTTYATLQYGDYTFGLDSDYFLYGFGGAWRVNDAISAKAQFVVYDEQFNDSPSEGSTVISQHVCITFVFLGFSILL
ncbi:MAG: hypothetical protein JXA28_07715 [Bacteroidetes bacterium]|nr:hypothetical protein [Bacteroidota bacterium]